MFPLTSWIICMCDETVVFLKEHEWICSVSTLLHTRACYDRHRYTNTMRDELLLNWLPLSHCFFFLLLALASQRHQNKRGNNAPNYKIIWWWQQIKRDSKSHFRGFKLIVSGDNCEGNVSRASWIFGEIKSRNNECRCRKQWKQ